MKSRILGIDIGNVIIDHRQIDGSDKTLLEERYSTIPVVPEAFETLKILRDRFNGQVYLISKCTDWARIKIKAWLDDNNFFVITNLYPQNIHFVRERHEKDEVCKKLGITDFIDDRLEVLGHMINTVPHLYLFRPDPIEVHEYKIFLPKVKRVNSWQEVLQVIG